REPLRPVPGRRPGPDARHGRRLGAGPWPGLRARTVGAGRVLRAERAGVADRPGRAARGEPRVAPGAVGPRPALGPGAVYRALPRPLAARHLGRGEHHLPPRLRAPRLAPPGGPQVRPRTATIPGPR